LGDERGYTRRSVLRAAGGAAAVGLLGGAEPWLARAAAGIAAGIRAPGSLPDPSRPAGEPTSALPFDHIVCLMQENHSFDNYFGMLPRRGQPGADGFTFDGAGTPLNSNPLGSGIVRVQHAPTPCQPTDITQSWTPTHQEIDHGRMDGFARVDQGQMLYYDQSDIPFYYSFANTFTVGNRWFCSAPCQTYPNRRFYLCGTAFGLISTDTSKVTQSPPNGTIVDRLNHYGITWKDYFVDVPGTAVIYDIPEKNPANMAPIDQFFADCAAGTLPNVCWVDPEIGTLNVVGSALAGKVPIGNGVANYSAAQDQDEENPADIQLGESFVQSVVDAVLSSPAWPRTLLVWIYDEHGGYYDHVPPPAAIKPDSIPPDLGPKDYPGGYDLYGPRVPAVVASAYSKPHGVTNVVHDHTSVLATIAAKWNLPAMTYRDANATTVADFLDPSKPALLEPPTLTGSGDVAAGEANCDSSDPKLTVLPAPQVTHVGRLIVKFLGRRQKAHGIVVELRTTSGTLSKLTVELEHRHSRHVLVRKHVKAVGTHEHKVVLHPHHHLPNGHYTLLVKRHGHVLVRRTVHLRGARSGASRPSTA
jgi:phospholipase C